MLSNAIFMVVAECVLGALAGAAIYGSVYALVSTVSSHKAKKPVDKVSVVTLALAATYTVLVVTGAVIGAFMAYGAAG
jgi:hypothetical protein